MGIDKLDQIQLIETPKEDIVLFGNKNGGIPVFVSEKQLEIFSCAVNNIYHPLVAECRNLLDFCEIEDIVLDIHSKKKEGYISDVILNNKKVGKYSLEEMIYLISASAPELRINENLLETDEYENISKANIPLKRLKKRVGGPTIEFPEDKFIKLDLETISKISNDSNSYKVSFSNGELKTCFFMPRYILPVNLLEKVKETNGLLMSDFKNRDSSYFDSLHDLLKSSKSKVKKAFVYDRQFVNDNSVYPENHADITCAIEVERNEKNKKFVLPDILGILYAMNIGKIWIREPIVLKENPNNPVYFG